MRSAIENQSLNSIHTRFLLDEARSPVARFRLLSTGVNTNTRLREEAAAVGDCACLTCGNCVDACPVVKANVGLVFQQNQRTSMALEHFVQDECRRCYRCVQACPQVGKDLKELAGGFRRVEKLTHLLAATTIVALMVTGILQYHYAERIGGLDAAVLKYVHRVLGAISVLIPLMYYKLDIRHFRRSLTRVFTWQRSDLSWLQQTLARLFTPARTRVSRREFNPGQKIWYLVILSFFPLIYATGLGAILAGLVGKDSFELLKSYHVALVLPFDIMLLIHVCIKYVRAWIQDGLKLLRNYRATGSFVYTGESILPEK